MDDGLLSPVERRRLIEEIGEVAMTIGRDRDSEFGPLPARSGRTAGLLTGQEQLAFLEAHLPILQAAIERIAADPLVFVVTTGQDVPFDRARRVTPRAVMQAAGRKTVDTKWSATGWLAERLSGRVPASLEEQVTVATTDTPENRWIAALLAGWRRDLASIAALARWTGDTAAASTAEGLLSRLRRLEAAEFLMDSCRYAPAAPPPRLLLDSRYRTLLKLDREHRRRLRIEWDAPAFTLPAREGWLLYETWCFLRTAAALMALGFRAVSGDSVQVRPGRLSLQLAKGRASRLRFSLRSQLVELYYNRAFAGPSADEAQPGSRSHTMIPDICLECRGRFLVLDAKYRSYDPPAGPDSVYQAGALYEDVDKMHAYRDAIVRSERPVVDAAWCLFPGRTEGPEIISYPTSSSHEPFGRAGIGALRLRPGRDYAPLAGLIASWLSTG